MAENQLKFTLLPKILNGSIAGIVGATATFPLDLVKTRLQKQTVAKDGTRMYNSIPDAFKKIFIAEGIFGMYRGAAIIIVLITPEKAVKLTANDYFRYHLKDKNGKLSLARQAAAGALTGVAHVFVTCPMELLKIQMQDAGRVASLSGNLDPLMGKSKPDIPKISGRQITMDLLRTRGFFGLYKGYFATLIRDVPWCVIFFPLFAYLDAIGPRKSDGSGDAKFYWSFTSGLIAASTSAIIMTPVDVMKTRIQSVTKQAAGDKTYSSVFAAASDIYKNEGGKAFFKGGACRVIVQAPLYAIVQGVYYLGIAEQLLGVEKDIKKVKK